MLLQSSNSTCTNKSHLYKHLFVLLFNVVVCLNAALGQELSKADSLSLQLENTKGQTEKIRLLSELVLATEISGHEDFKVFYNQLVELSQNTNDNYSLALAHRSFAVNNYNQNNLSEASVYFQKASDLFKAENYLNEANLALCKVGVMQYTQGYFQKAEETYNEVLKNTLADSLKESRAQAYLNQGSSYLRQSLLEKAEANYSKSLELFKELQDSLLMIACMNNLGIIYYETKQIDKSLATFEQIKDYHRRKGNDNKLAVVLANLAEFNFQLSKSDQALDYAKEAYFIAIKTNSKRIQEIAINTIARIYNKNEEYESALTFLEKAIELNGENIFGKIMTIEIKGEILKKMKNYDEAIKTYEYGLDMIRDNSDYSGKLANITIPLAEVYYAKGDIEKAKTIISEDEIDQMNSPHYVDLFNYLKSKISKEENKIDLAIKYGEPAFENMLKSERIEYSYELARTLSEAYENKKNFSKALYYSNQHNILGDSLNNVEKVKTITKKTKDFEFELERRDLVAAQEQQKAILKAETRQSRMIAGSIGVFALLSFFSFLNFRKKNKIITSQNKQLQSLNQTKDQIFSIIGHDLKKPALAFRGITSKLNYLLKKGDNERLLKFGDSIETDAIELNKLTDNLLNWALLQKDLVSIESKVLPLNDLVTENLALFSRIAKDKNVSLESNITVGSVKSDRHVLSTVIRNLIDNAIKYTPEGGTVRITAEEQDDKIMLSVQDNGIGMGEKQISGLFLLNKDKSTRGTAGEGGTGLGLHLVHELINKVGGQIKVASQLDNGTRFDIKLPV